MSAISFYNGKLGGAEVPIYYVYFVRVHLGRIAHTIYIYIYIWNSKAYLVYWALITFSVVDSSRVFFFFFGTYASMLPQKSRTFPGVSRPITERIGIFWTKFKQADDKISQPICWQSVMKTKRKKKKRSKRKRQFLMDNVTNLFGRKRINQQSMSGNFQYEKIVWIYILSIFGEVCI